MAAGDVTITRGIGFRDDALATTNWSFTTTANVSASISTDGDQLSFPVTFTNAVGGNNATLILTVVGTPDSQVYKNIMTRHKDSGNNGSGQVQVAVKTFAGGNRTDNINSNTSTYVQETTPTTGLSGALTAIQILVTAQVSITSLTFTVTVDFIQAFKENLTLPAVSQPLQLTLSRYVVELPIPTREGGALQDLGSSSAQVEIAGTLITTTSPNNYTGDQWWDVLLGTWLEANWQWLSSDRVSYKYQIEQLTGKQDPGRVGYYEFKLRLRKVDVLSATAQTFASSTGTGAIQ